MSLIHFTAIDFFPHSHGDMILYAGNEQCGILHWADFEKCEMGFHQGLVNYFTLTYEVKDPKEPEFKAEFFALVKELTKNMHSATINTDLAMCDYMEKLEKRTNLGVWK